MHSLFHLSQLVMGAGMAQMAEGLGFDSQAVPIVSVVVAILSKMLLPNSHAVS